MMVKSTISIGIETPELNAQKPDPADEFKGQFIRQFVRNPGVEETDIGKSQPAYAHHITILGEDEVVGIRSRVFYFNGVLLEEHGKYFFYFIKNLPVSGFMVENG